MTAPGIFEGTGMPAPGWWDALWPKPAEVLSAVGVRSGTDVVDLCSGDGWFTLAIARLARRVIAIDLDATLLATARMRLAEGGLTNCSFAQADAYDVAKVVSDPVDHVFLANVFHGVPDRPRLAGSSFATSSRSGPITMGQYSSIGRENCRLQICA